MKTSLRAIIVAAAAFAACASGQPSRVAPDLQNVTTNVDVIVRFKGVPTQTMLTSVTAKGGSLTKTIPRSRFALFNLTPTAVTALATNTNVIYASPNRKLKRKLEFAEPAVHADVAFQFGFDGMGVGIAIVDSGIGSHADLNQSGNGANSRVVYAENFSDGTNVTDDEYGHGTQVAGVAAGNASRSTTSWADRTFRGIAPNANLINLRVLDTNGAGSDINVIQAIYRAIALKSTYNIRVLNLSLGRPVTESYTLDPLCQAVEDAWRAGIVVVVAAGNEGRNNSQNTHGYGTITSPGNDPFVVTVGAMKDMGTVTRDDDAIASYSSKGPTLLDHVAKPDLVAPGNKIIATLARNGDMPMLYPDNVVPVDYYTTSANTDPSSYYFNLSGTSIAAPIVSGAAALLIQKDPTLTPDTVKARLMKTATKNFPKSTVACDSITGVCYTSYYDIFTVGAGYLDVWAALNSTDTVDPKYSAASPVVTTDFYGNVRMVNSSSIVWGSTIVWGSSIVWGTSAVTSTNTIVEPNSIVWGTTTMQGYSIVWGSTVVWGTTTPFAEALSVKGE